MGYVACNEKLEKVLVDCANEKSGSLVRAPWLSGSGLTGAGRIAAVAAISNGLLGVASNGSAYKFYYGRERTGNWLFEVWTVWKAAAFAVALLLIAGLFLSIGSVVASGVGLVVVGALSMVVFGGRSLALGRHWAVAAVIGGDKYAAGVIPSVFGMAAGIGYLVAGVAKLAGVKVGLFGGFEGWSEISLTTGLALAAVKVIFWYVVVVVASKFFWAYGLEIPSIRATVDVASKSRYYTDKVYRSNAGAEIDAEYGAPRRKGNGLVFVLFFVVLAAMVVWPLVG